jgi:hypothetical protein
MTEQGWLGCIELEPMLTFLQDKGSERKRRLFAVACCRRIWHRLKDKRSRTAVTVAERYADGLATDEDRKTALAESERAYMDAGEDDAAEGAASFAAHANEEPEIPGSDFAEQAASEAAFASSHHQRSAAAQMALLRDIFGNPYRAAISVHPWVTPTAHLIAQAAYDLRKLPAGHLEPDRLAVLSDALEEAGCADAAILDHLRSPGPHVRGCWSLDLILGKR